ncbi:MAG: G-D-S-L family lipolytic protein [Bacteroidetes bacterium]|nr:G-D-S-L family lipolytic protein [Bacteroidota bacterium]
MKRNCLLVLLFFTNALTFAQPFASDIAAFKKQDSLSFPEKGQILFVGSSSFTMWKDVQSYLPDYKIINRGFGGLSLTDVIHFAGKIIFPYQPKQIVIYCGENDIAVDSTVTGTIVYKRFKKLFYLIRKSFTDIPLVYISMKPSPSRWVMKRKMTEGNRFIEKFLRKKKNTRFVNVWDAMLGVDGLPNQEIFLKDKLHMNARGYALWQKLIEPYFMK